MLNLIQKEAFEYSKSQLTGDEMPESEKLNILKRMIERKQKISEEEEKKNK